MPPPITTISYRSFTREPPSSRENGRRRSVSTRPKRRVTLGRLGCLLPRLLSVDARVRLALASLFVLGACGPIEVPAGHISDHADGPSVFRSDVSPRSRSVFMVAVNDAAHENGGAPGFSVASRELGLDDRAGPLLPVRVALV